MVAETAAAESADCFFDIDILNFQIPVYLLETTVAQPKAVVCNLSGAVVCQPLHSQM